MGLAERYTVLRLSHQMTGVVEEDMFNSLRRDCSQEISATKVATLRYSASVEDLETVCCFQECQETKFGPRKRQYPDMEWRSSTSDAQSASQNPIKLMCELELC